MAQHHFVVGSAQHGRYLQYSSIIRFAHKDYLGWRDDVQYIILDDIHWKDICPIAKGLLIASDNVILTGEVRF